jgi:hypothetical protein
MKLEKALRIGGTYRGKTHGNPCQAIQWEFAYRGICHLSNQAKLKSRFPYFLSLADGS